MRAFFRRFPFVVVAPLILAACQSPPPPTPVSRLPPQLTRPPTPLPEGTSPSPSSPVLPSAADLVADPMNFRGLSRSDISAMLGQPSFQRHDNDAEIWQYYGPASACVLDLFLYPDQGIPRVAHAELRTRSGGTAAANACLSQILDGRRG